MTWLKRPEPPLPPQPQPAPLYAIKSPQRGYYAPGGVVWSTTERALADAQLDVVKKNEPGYDWRVFPLRRVGKRAGPSEVKA